MLKLITAVALAAALPAITLAQAPPPAPDKKECCEEMKHGGKDCCCKDMDHKDHAKQGDQAKHDAHADHQR
jgi:hypothetical protein